MAQAQVQGAAQAGAGGQATAQAGPPYPMASLYVGDLHWDVSEAQLFEKFSQCGSILSIRVCRDMTTRRSLGYAYVNFQNPQDAERALDTLNYEVVKGRPIRIMWSQRDPTLRRSGVGNIFIKNLDKTIDNKALYDTFSAFGNILSCKIATDETGQSKGFGFVHFDSEEAARMAIDKVNGMLLNGKKVYVGVFVPRKDRARQEGEKKFTNCYIKNLPEDINDEELRKMFEPFGSALSVKVMTSDDGKSRGFGFVSFKEPEEAEQAVAEFNNKEITGPSGQKRTVFVCRAQKKSEREAELRDRFEKAREERQRKWQGVNLYVKNLDEDVDDTKLAAEFGKHGTVTSAKVMLDPSTRKSRGFGFVCYSTPEEATRAITNMNGSSVFKKPLYVALAQRKEDRQAQLAAQYVQRVSTMRMQLAGANAFTGVPPGANPAQQAAAMYGAPAGIAAPYYLQQQRMGMYPQGPAGIQLPPGAGGSANRTRFAPPGSAGAAMRGGPGMPPYAGGVAQAVSGVGLYQQGGPSGVNMGQFAGLPVGGPAFRGAPPFGPGMLQNAAAQMGMQGGFGQRVNLRPTGQFSTAPQTQSFGTAPGGQSQSQQQQQINAAMAAGAQRAITGTNQPPQGAAGPFGNISKPGVSGPPRGATQQQQQPSGAPVNSNMMQMPQQFVRMAGAGGPMMRLPTGAMPPGGMMQPGMRMPAGAAMMQQQLAMMPAAGSAPVASGQPMVTSVATVPQQQPVAAEALTAGMLAQAAQADPGTAKQILGERLYPLISDWYPSLAGKLTGMLLEMDNVELLHMLEAKDVLRAKVSEAYEVLKEHQRKEKDGDAGDQSEAAAI